MSILAASESDATDLLEGGFALSVEFLTGRYVAADTAAREQAEWPPHPGRLFMALSASYFERDGDEAERAALEWFSNLAPPEVWAPLADSRTAVACFVPVNDKNEKTKATLQSAPGIPRKRQERHFPTSIPRSPTTEFVWREADGIELHFEALARISNETIRLGHSSSLVHVRAHRSPDPSTIRERQLRRWGPGGRNQALRMRISGPGDLDRLRLAYPREQNGRFAELTEIIKSTKGKAKNAAKARFEEEFGTPYAASLHAPQPSPASVAGWARYGILDRRPHAAVCRGTTFDTDLIILTLMDGRTVDLQDAIFLTRALRGATLKKCETETYPEWLSGHCPDSGKPSTQPHVAFLPLAHVDAAHADGHILGLGIALPKGISQSERGRYLAPLFVDTDTGELKDSELVLGRRGKWALRLEQRTRPPRSLDPGTWTRSFTTWATVTPIVLDAFPRTKRASQREAWEAEVAEILATSCRRAGLPTPQSIEISTTSWLVGSPRATAKRRRGHSQDPASESALGAGFAPFHQGTGRPPKPQIHAHLTWDVPVQGPLLLGAGRYLGYGLLKPTTRHQSDHERAES